MRTAIDQAQRKGPHQWVATFVDSLPRRIEELNSSDPEIVDDLQILVFTIRIWHRNLVRVAEPTQSDGSAAEASMSEVKVAVEQVLRTLLALQGHVQSGLCFLKLQAEVSILRDAVALVLANVETEGLA